MTVYSIVGLALILGLGLAGVLYSAGASEPLGLLAAAAVVNLLLFAVTASERRSLRASGASRSLIESATARGMGMIWLWGAVSSGAGLQHGYVQARVDAFFGSLRGRRPALHRL